MIMPMGKAIKNVNYCNQWFKGLSKFDAIDGGFATLQREIATATENNRRQSAHTRKEQDLLQCRLDEIPLHDMYRVYPMLLACFLRSYRYRSRYKKLWREKSLLKTHLTCYSYDKIACNMLSYLNCQHELGSLVRHPSKEELFPSTHVLLDLSRSMADVRVVCLLVAKALLRSNMALKVYVADELNLINISDTLKSVNMSDISEYASCYTYSDKRCFSSVLLDYGVFLEHETMPKKVLVLSDALFGSKLDEIAFTVWQIKQKNVNFGWLNPIIGVARPNLPIVSFRMLQRELNSFLPAWNLQVLQASMQNFLEQ